MVTAGTITRRAVEPTWLTASNARVQLGPLWGDVGICVLEWWEMSWGWMLGFEVLGPFSCRCALALGEGKESVEASELHCLVKEEENTKALVSVFPQPLLPQARESNQVGDAPHTCVKPGFDFGSTIQAHGEC